MKRSPTLEGFKAIFRQPSLGLAEIAWRWSLGVAGFASFIFAAVEYFDSLPVTATDMFLLRTHQPVLIGRAFDHILRGSLPRLLEALILLGLAFSVAWVIVASLGRAATLKTLLNHVVEPSPENQQKSWRLGSLVGLNSLRAAATLAATVGIFGAILIGDSVSPADDPSPGTAFLLFLVIFGLVNLAWLAVNWFLSLASVFVFADGENISGSMAAAADFCRQHLGAVLAVSFWFGLAHFAAFFFASSLGTLLLSFLAVLPAAVVFTAVLLVTLVYFAIADFLYVGRLAAYVWIAEHPGTLATPVAFQPQSPGPPPPAPNSGRIDPDELILSDVPLPVSP